MNPEAASKLHNRNTKIIEILLRKIDKNCPGSVDIIGIAGSFANEQYDERSDLDLCIITNNPNASVINKCFILDGIGFDLYCTPWKKMEEMSEYTTPYVTKLLNLKIVFTSNKSAENKYMELQKNLQEKMKDTKASLTTAKNYCDKAYQAYALLILSNSAGECWFNLYQMLTNIESGLFIINRDYIKKGVKNVPEEISHLKNLPENFISLYKNLFESFTIEELKTNATKLAQSTKNFMESKYKKPTESISSQKIIGTYEEIFSNWKNKVERAVEINDIYSQFMAISR